MLTTNNTKKAYSSKRTIESYRNFMEEIYEGIIATVPMDQEEDEGFVTQVREFFESLSWVNGGVFRLDCCC